MLESRTDLGRRFKELMEGECPGLDTIRKHAAALREAKHESTPNECRKLEDFALFLESFKLTPTGSLSCRLIIRFNGDGAPVEVPMNVSLSRLGDNYYYICVMNTNGVWYEDNYKGVIEALVDVYGLLRPELKQRGL